MKSSNALIIQSGGSTPVINRSLAGILIESLKTDSFDKLYGAIHGIKGLLNKNLTDLSNIKPSDISLIAKTASTIVLRLTIFNLCGSNLWSITFTNPSLISIHIVVKFFPSTSILTIVFLKSFKNCK